SGRSTASSAGGGLGLDSLAAGFGGGGPLFRALPLEYPPFALAPFALTLFPAGAGPFVAFGLWMGGFAVLVYLTLALGVSRRAAISFGVYLVVGAIAVALSRYDLVPVAFTVVAWLAAERRRFTLAYALLAVGVLLKLYPLFLFPTFAIAHWRYLRSFDGVDLKAPSSVISTSRACSRIALSLAAPLAGMLFAFGLV